MTAAATPLSTGVVYVLKLQGNRWYVGTTLNVARRLEEHMGGMGAAWTQRYKPIDIAEVRPILTPYDEDNVTKEYMSKYGITAVRGGTYATPKLTRGQTSALLKEIRHTAGVCLKCGSGDHFIGECPLDEAAAAASSKPLPTVTAIAPPAPSAHTAAVSSGRKKPTKPKSKPALKPKPKVKSEGAKKTRTPAKVVVAGVSAAASPPQQQRRRAGPGHGKCGRCGRFGCFTAMCKAWKDVDGNIIRNLEEEAAEVDNVLKALKFE